MSRGQHFFLLLVTALAILSGNGLALAAPVDGRNSAPEANGFLGKIKHVIVLMLENRSFDHMLGFAKKLLHVDGLTGDEFNWVDPSVPHGEKIIVSDDAFYINECDPDHSTPATKTKVEDNMGNFVSFENTRGHSDKNYCDVMRGFPPERLPVLTTLAQEFAVMDKFFCSHPGPTWPNRMFCLSATSAGSTETGTWYHSKVGSLFPQQTIFDQVDAAGLEWRNYFNDTPWELFMESIAHSPENLKNMDTFYSDARKGNLPSYAWINPRSGVNMTTGEGSQDQHPDHDVAFGERYIKDIYEALRASPQWNETLFVITYDEHGGFYDHVQPPVDIPAPGDEETSYPDAGYDFTKLGVRIPTVLVSPWIKKGTIISDPPPMQKPFSNSKYDLTSIMSSARKLLGMPLQNLTDRDGWAGTFEHVVTELDTPRKDCPIHLPSAPAPTIVDEGRLPLNDLQKDIADVHSHVAFGASPCQELHKMSQGDISEWLQNAYNVHAEQTLRWKQSKIKTNYSIVCKPHKLTTFKEKSFQVHPNHTTSSYSTISTMTLANREQEHYCLDSGGALAGSPVGISLCYPSPIVSQNRDKAQHWRVLNDATIRPFQNDSLCITNNDPNTDLHNVSVRNAVYLDVCDGRVEQFYSYHSTARDGIVAGEFLYGDDANVLGVQ